MLGVKPLMGGGIEEGYRWGRAVPNEFVAGHAIPHPHPSHHPAPTSSFSSCYLDEHAVERILTAGLGLSLAGFSVTRLRRPRDDDEETGAGAG